MPDGRGPESVPRLLARGLSALKGCCEREVEFGPVSCISQVTSGNVFYLDGPRWDTLGSAPIGLLARLGCWPVPGCPNPRSTSDAPVPVLSPPASAGSRLLAPAECPALCAHCARSCEPGCVLPVDRRRLDIEQEALIIQDLMGREITNARPTIGRPGPTCPRSSIGQEPKTSGRRHPQCLVTTRDPNRGQDRCRRGGSGAPPGFWRVGRGEGQATIWLEEQRPFKPQMRVRSPSGALHLKRQLSSICQGQV